MVANRRCCFRRLGSFEYRLRASPSGERGGVRRNMSSMLEVENTTWGEIGGRKGWIQGVVGCMER